MGIFKIFKALHLAKDLVKQIMLKNTYLKICRNFNFSKSLQFLQPKINDLQGRRKFFQSSYLLNDDAKDKDKENTESVENKTDKAKETSGKTVLGKAELFKTLNLENDKRSEVFSIKQEFQYYELEECPETETEISRFDAVTMYRDMQIIRVLERAASALYREKIIRGFCHLYMGQEAVAVGMKSALRPNDNVITAYRCHGWCYVMGISVEGILAELAGKSAGVQRGKGGSMHMYSSDFYGGNGIVGAQVPLGVGIALASRYKGDGGVCVSLYGDGAANQGQVFEVYNMACLWKLPVIFVCENNKYGMGTSAKRSSCNSEYFTRGDYIPGLWVDGMDIVAVRCATKFAVDYVLKHGPIVLEMHTYRYQGHSMSDPGTSYRSRDEIEDVRKTMDPIATFKQRILDSQLVNEEEIQLIDKQIKKEVDDALNVAKTSKEIDLSELAADVYSNNLETKIRGIIEWNLTHKQINKGKNIP